MGREVEERYPMRIISQGTDRAGLEKAANSLKLQIEKGRETETSARHVFEVSALPGERFSWKEKAAISGCREKVVGEGTQFRTFVKQTMMTELDDIQREFYILVDSELPPERIKKSSKIKTSWILIDPVQPYLFENGKAWMQTWELQTDADTYGSLISVGVCLYDMDQDIVYPLTINSLKTVGKLMEAPKLCRNPEDNKLAIGMGLADALLRVPYWGIVHYSGMKQVRPVLDLTRKQNRQRKSYMTSSFFTKIMDAVPYPTELCHWRIAADVSTMRIKMAADPRLETLMKISELHLSEEIQAIYRMGDEMILKSWRYGYFDELSEEEIHKIWEETLEVYQKLPILFSRSKEILLDDSEEFKLLTDHKIAEAIGSSRMKDLLQEIDGVNNGYDFLCRVMSFCGKIKFRKNYRSRERGKQRDMLKKNYFPLLLDISDHAAPSD